jgi:hypothetical protein
MMMAALDWEDPVNAPEPEPEPGFLLVQHRYMGDKVDRAHG